MTAMHSYTVIAVEREDHVATLWLDRPDARNAMGPEFFTELPIAMNELSADTEVRAVILAARGPHFSVGLDLKAMAGPLTGAGVGVGATESPDNQHAPPSPAPQNTPPSPAPDQPTPSVAYKAWLARAEILRLQRSISSVAACPKPVIAAVHGYCIGGGVDLVSACDIRLASMDAIFSLRETKVAIVADLGSLQRLARIVGKGHLAELAYTGKDILALRAKEMGLVNDVLPDAGSAVLAARKMAGEIAANSPLAVQGTKAVLAACESRSVAEGLDYVATWNAGFLESDDLAEAMTAFLTKRPPEFKGR